MSAHKACVTALLAVLAGCAATGPDYQRPAQTLPAHFAVATAAEAAGTRGASPDEAANEGTGSNVAGLDRVPSGWWRLYGDPALDRLVDATLTRNTDLRFAVAQVDEAEAVLREARALLAPLVDLAAGSTRAGGSRLASPPVPAGTSVLARNQRIAVSTSFELDFWGRLRRAAEAVDAQLLASQFGRDVVALSLAGASVQAWFALRSLDAQIAVTLESLRVREEGLVLARARARGGMVSDLDVNQAEGARADAAVQLNELQRQRATVERLLGTLSGQLDLRVPAGDLQAMPSVPLPPPGLPSSLLNRRPDIRQAEAGLQAANARIGVARAAMMPSISLTGLFGAQSAALSDLLSSGGRIWSIGVGLSLPIFDSGRLQARLEQAEARERQALIAYQRAAELAYREVADALGNNALGAVADRELQARVATARNTSRLARTRYEAGYSAYLEVLDALRSQNDAELALVRNRQARLSYSADLMKALGGGWDEDSSASARNGERSRNSSR